MTLMQLYREGKQVLASGGLAEAGEDAFLLLEHVSQVTRSTLYADPDRAVPPSEEGEYRSLLKKRLCHVPVQYLTGEAWFFGHPFLVTPSVLIPRQDTEVLVERALTLLKGRERGAKILDLCTGSGCILLSLLLSLPGAEGTGTDLSEEALVVARANQEALGTRATFLQGDLFDIEKLCGKKYTLICSNPPYIPSKEVEGLMREVRDHEPRLALDGGEDGLGLYRRIVRDAGEHLEPEGTLLMEIGYDQGEAVRGLCLEAGFSARVHQDLAGHDRVVEATLPASQGGRYV